MKEVDDFSNLHISSHITIRDKESNKILVQKSLNRPPNDSVIKDKVENKDE